MLKFLVFVGIITIPIWGVLFCLNLISIIEKIKYEESYGKNKFWLTLSFVIIISILAITNTQP